MIIVVEGKNDFNKIRLVFKDAYVVMTNGSAVDSEIIDRLKTLSKENEIVLCLDPDHAGERIRRIISNHIPTAKHVFANHEAAISKNGKKIGIEHMTTNDIKLLFKEIKAAPKENKITKMDLFDLGLSGVELAFERRRKLGVKLHIGYANAKQFLYRINMANISKEQLRSLLEDDC